MVIPFSATHNSANQFTYSPVREQLILFTTDLPWWATNGRQGLKIFPQKHSCCIAMAVADRPGLHVKYWWYISAPVQTELIPIIIAVTSSAEQD